MHVTTARPILKWAGGKRQVLAQLRRFYPASFDDYIEPFVGSGAVFLDLHNTGRLDGSACSCRTSTRSAVLEYLITNVPQAAP